MAAPFERFSGDQLRWVRTNRERRRKAVSIGLTAGSLDTPQMGSNRLARQVFDAILGVADEEFCRMVRFADLRGGELVLLVSDPNSLYHIRANWHAVLREVLQRRLPHRAITRITFRTGSDGAAFVP